MAASVDAADASLRDLEARQAALGGGPLSSLLGSLTPARGAAGAATTPGAAALSLLGRRLFAGEEASSTTLGGSAAVATGAVGQTSTPAPKSKAAEWRRPDMVDVDGLLDRALPGYRRHGGPASSDADASRANVSKSDMASSSAQSLVAMASTSVQSLLEFEDEEAEEADVRPDASVVHDAAAQGPAGQDVAPKAGADHEGEDEGRAAEPAAEPGVKLEAGSDAEDLADGTALEF